MQIVTTQADLDTLCADYASEPYVTVDTEFMRERTYWPILCLIQIARPRREGEAAEAGAAIIDPIAGDLDLAPLFDLMANTNVVKVFHAARQDVEIFHHLGGVIPAPLFDTQVAAMVCGFGDQVGYETLVRGLANASLDKSARFTDWSRRPLSEKQLRYALGDVTHLRVVYDRLSTRVERAGRAHWVREEMAILTDPGTYFTEPKDAWRRIKNRNTKGKFLIALQKLAEWRESEAQNRDVPRNRIMKDDALLELAATRPRSLDDLSRSRLLREHRSGKGAEAVLSVMKAIDAVPQADWPSIEEPTRGAPTDAALSDLLKVLLKAKSAELDVAQRLIASAADLEALARGAEDVAALSGWRREAFGEDALRLKRGEIALSAGPSGVRVIPLSDEGAA